jgi:hypothetical protein
MIGILEYLQLQPGATRDKKKKKYRWWGEFWKPFEENSIRKRAKGLVLEMLSYEPASRPSAEEVSKKFQELITEEFDVPTEGRVSTLLRQLDEAHN